MNTTIGEVQEMIDRYAAWVKDKTVLREMQEWVEITTPYLDRHNDVLQIYAKRENGGFLLTDDGYIIRDLASAGCDLKTPKRQELLNLTLRGFGVQRENDALTVRATRDNFALRKHNLVQAMLAVNDLFYLAAPMVNNLFFEDVALWFDLNDVRYTPRVKFTGKTGFDHMFDFVIPKSRQQPERIVKTINHPTKDAAESYVLSWVDTRGVREVDSRAYAFLNDGEIPVSSSVVTALRNYDITPVMWSRREQSLAELAA